MQQQRLAEYRANKMAKEEARRNELANQFPVLFSPKRIDNMEKDKINRLAPSIRNKVNTTMQRRLTLVENKENAENKCEELVMDRKSMEVMKIQTLKPFQTEIVEIASKVRSPDIPRITKRSSVLQQKPILTPQKSSRVSEVSSINKKPRQSSIIMNSIRSLIQQLDASRDTTAAPVELKIKVEEELSVSSLPLPSIVSGDAESVNEVEVHSSENFILNAGGEEILVAVIDEICTEEIAFTKIPLNDDVVAVNNNTEISEMSNEVTNDYVRVTKTEPALLSQPSDTNQIENNEMYDDNWSPDTLAEWEPTWKYQPSPRTSELHPLSPTLSPRLSSISTCGISRKSFPIPEEQYTKPQQLLADGIRGHYLLSTPTPLSFHCSFGGYKWSKSGFLSRSYVEYIMHIKVIETQAKEHVALDMMIVRRYTEFESLKNELLQVLQQFNYGVLDRDAAILTEELQNLFPEKSSWKNMIWSSTSNEDGETDTTEKFLVVRQHQLHLWLSNVLEFLSAQYAKLRIGDVCTDPELLNSVLYKILMFLTK